MKAQDLEQVLRDLPRTGTLVKDRGYRQVWRFEWQGRAYYLKFYPRLGFLDTVRRRFLGSKALREFRRLQWLQKAGVAAPRAVASLLGFRLAGRKGDAIILEAIEPAIGLDQYLNDYEMRGLCAPEHLKLVRQVVEILQKLGRAGLGHKDLHLGNFILSRGQLYITDGYSVHRRGLRKEDLLLLAASARPYANLTDMYRVWTCLCAGAPMPGNNRRGVSLWRKMMRRVLREGRYFGRLRMGRWHGYFYRKSKFAQRWSLVSRMEITERDWEQAWPQLLSQIASDQFEVLKRTVVGDVLAGEIVLGGRPVAVVIKRPWRKYWYRYINEIGRGARARRAWKKAWMLILRGIPTAWPLLLMEKRFLGYVTDCIVVFERIVGQTLSRPVWVDENRQEYHKLLHRAGRLLRQLEQTGLFLYDAKSDNWMVRRDEKLGLVPMLIDVDGVRRTRSHRGGIRRLLRSLRENPLVAFDPSDGLALARGYAPFASDPDLQRMLGLQILTPAATRGEPQP